MKFRIRAARLDEVDILAELIKASVRGLQADDYSQRELEGAIESVYGVDTQLIQDAGGCFPNSVKDVVNAAYWLTINAEQYNLDPSRIAMLGESA